MRIGVLTGGGDCPGLNAVIRSIVRKAETQLGAEIIGFYDSWDGVMEQRYSLLKTNDVRGIAPKGGTILGTRRGGPFDEKDGVANVACTAISLVRIADGHADFGHAVAL